MIRPIPVSLASLRAFTVVLLALGLAVGTASITSAQGRTSGEGAPTLLERDVLSGDWGGIRPGLDRRGVALELTYAGDVFANAAGGLRRRAVYLHNVDVTLSVDAEQAFGWTGGQIFVYGLGNYGGSPSDHVGDLQGVNNIEAPAAWRLYEAWVEQRLSGGRFSVRAGLYDLNSEFYVLEAAGLFLNSAQGIGPEIAETGPNGPSIFPLASLALRVRMAPSDAVYVQAAAFDAVPGDVRRPEATHVHLSAAEGALLTTEIGWHPGGRLGSKYAIGSWMYTSSTDGFAATEMPGVSSAAGRGSAGLYLLAEEVLYREAGTDGQGLAAFARLGVADGRSHPVRSSWGAGLVYTGLFPARRADRIGLGVAAAHLQRSFVEASRSAGRPLDGAEVTLEATYQVQIAPWLTLRPDVQYVINPSMQPATADAVVFGLRSEISF